MAGFNTSRILAILSRNKGFLLLERGFPQGDLKGDILIARRSDGTQLTGRDEYGHVVPVPVGQVHLEDFLRASLIALDDDESTVERQVYRLTAEGARRGLEVAAADGE